MINDNFRKDFPFFKNNPTRVYLDNASTTHKPYVVLDAMHKFYHTTYASANRGDYDYSYQAYQSCEDTRELIKNFIGADKVEEIGFVSSSTLAFNLCAHSLRNYINKSSIIISNNEHSSSVMPWYLELTNDQIKVVNIDQVINAITNDTKLIVITHMCNASGKVNDIATIIKSIKQQNSNIIVLIDAVQSASQLNIKVADWGCDILVFGGHKIYGPNSISVLYIRKSIHKLMMPLLVGGGLAKNKKDIINSKTKFSFEAGTIDTSAIIGLGEAIKYLSPKLDICRKKYQSLSQILYEELLNISPAPNILNYNYSSITSFYWNSLSSYDIGLLLQDRGYYVRTGMLCNYLNNNPRSIRISLGIYNNLSEIKEICHHLKDIVNILYS